jgi:hypothetical protein
VQQGSPQTVYKQPVDEYVAGLFGTYTAVTVRDQTVHFLRPEDFTLSVTETPGAQKGFIVKSLFFGGFCELEIAVSGMMYLVRSERLDWNPGQSIWVQPKVS